MYRFLLSPRWIFGLVGCLVAALVMVGLADWQWTRLQDTRRTNAMIVADEHASVVPESTVLPTQSWQHPAKSNEWRRISATGVYLPNKTVLIRGKTYNGPVGFEVVVPIKTTDGDIVFVDRGWIAAPPQATDVPKIPTPPTGEVTVVGWARIPDPASSDEKAMDKIQGVDTVRSIDPYELAQQLHLTTRGGYISAVSESPNPLDAPARLPLPDLSEGPYLAYAIQWVLFAGMAIGAWFIYARREAHPEDDEDEFDSDDLDHEDDVAPIRKYEEATQ